MTDFSRALLTPRIKVGRDYVQKAQTKEQVGVLGGGGAGIGPHPTHPDPGSWVFKCLRPCFLTRSNFCCLLSSRLWAASGE